MSSAKCHAICAIRQEMLQDLDSHSVFFLHSVKQKEMVQDLDNHSVFFFKFRELERDGTGS
jgi:hypothetical protein